MSEKTGCHEGVFPSKESRDAVGDALKFEVARRKAEASALQALAAVDDALALVAEIEDEQDEIERLRLTVDEVIGRGASFVLERDAARAERDALIELFDALLADYAEAAEQHGLSYYERRLAAWEAIRNGGHQSQ